MTHLLDTSAFLAFFLGERGAEHVKSLFVHRDPHFRSIDNELLKQIDLGKTSSTS